MDLFEEVIQKNLDEIRVNEAKYIREIYFFSHYVRLLTQKHLLNKSNQLDICNISGRLLG